MSKFTGEMSHAPDTVRLGVAHIISGLLGGGAERMLLRLLAHSARDRFAHTVFSLTGRGELADPIEALGVKVVTLNMPPGIPDPFGMFRLRSQLSSNRYDIIQTWMYHADLIGGLCSLGLHIPVVWNIRADVVPFSEDRKTYVLTRACALLSGSVPDRIVCCSTTARRSHESMGYDRRKIVTIQNGFELFELSEPEYEDGLKEELGIPPGIPVIGLVTRDDPRKDLPNFFVSASIIHREMPEVHFVLCGNSITWDNKSLVNLADRAGIKGNCHFLGRRDDVRRVMSAFDIATLSSSSEAFPNVLGEAMSCAVPCVSTDVGDAAHLIGDTGIVVPPGNPAALADGWRLLLGMKSEERRKWGRMARNRIERLFSIDSVTAQYERLYADLGGLPHK